MAYKMRNFTEELRLLRLELLEMGERVKQQFEDAVHYIVHDSEDDRSERDQLAEQIIRSDQQIDHYDDQIHKNALQLISIQPPLPEELQALSAIMRIARELERMGDHAVNIAELQPHPHIQENDDIVRIITSMHEMIQKMLKEVLTMIETEDVQKASKIEEADQHVDDQFEQLQQLLIKNMKQHPEQIDLYAQLFLMNRYLERSADHVVNIARRVEVSIV